VSVTLNPAASARIKEFTFSFADLDIKTRSAGGNQVTKYPVRTVKLKEKGVSTISAPKIYFDAEIGRLNQDGYGKLLGRFNEEDRILAFYTDGTYELNTPDMSNRYDVEKLKLITKFDAEQIISVVYYDKKNAQFYAKRFHIETQTLNNRFLAIREGAGNYLELATVQEEPVIELDYGKKYEKESMDLAASIDVTGWKAIGTKIGSPELKKALLISEESDASEESTAPAQAPTLF